MDELEELKSKIDFLDQLEGEDLQKEEPSDHAALANTKQTKKLSPAQKFIVSFLAFLVILIFGIFVMLVTGKMILPF